MIYVLLLIAFLLSLILTRLLTAFLRRKAILDMPNERSNHKIPIPRGGGIVITGIIVLGMLYMSLGNPIIISGMIALAAISLLDDLRGMPIWARFGVQILMVTVGIIALPANAIFQGLLPPFADKLLAGLCWLWFINLYNFMDGIDGIAGSETIAIAIGVATLVLLASLPINYAICSLLIIAATAGFLVWNWHPARIFMGDVGSIPLGYILGWLLLLLASHGYWSAALIFPGYYLADSSITLIRRLLQGKKIWQAHSEHFYQQAVRAGKRHNEVVMSIIFANLLLFILGIVSIFYDWVSLGGAVVVIGGLLYYLKPKAAAGSLLPPGGGEPAAPNA
jgi:UDP-N-acetylmuramyl pentapeptide phosphotransferase/UDP-N-acetylglucosamine-1-phosphate transferase